MSDSTHKSYLRDSHGPRAVDAGHSRDKSSRSDSRRADDSSKSRSSTKHTSSRRPSKSEATTHRRKPSSTSTAGPHSTTAAAERPTFELDIIGQPHRTIPLGVTVETSVMVSLKVPSPDLIEQYRDIDTSRLMGVVSLVSSGERERVAVECGTLTGQKLFDSVHSIPDQVAGSLARSQPCRIALGYVSFPDLLIRQHGTYRLRVTLMKMGREEAGAVSLLDVDSEAIKVERRTPVAGNGRKHQRG